MDTTVLDENYMDGMIQVSNDEICEVIANYYSSAFMSLRIILHMRIIMADFDRCLYASGGSYDL